MEWETCLAGSSSWNRSLAETRFPPATREGRAGPEADIGWEGLFELRSGRLFQAGKPMGTPAVSVASAAGASHQQQRDDDEQHEERDPANELEHQQSHARSTSDPSTELVRWPLQSTRELRTQNSLPSGSARTTQDTSPWPTSVC